MANFTHPKSDELAGLREIFQNTQLFSWIADIMQIRLIVDASAIVEDVRWLSCVAENPSARTNLLEAIQAGTILAYAPTFIDKELAKNLRILSEEESVSVETLQAQWERYRPYLRFVECGGPDGTFLDPKDAPYVKLQRELEAPVSTRDPHFERMEVPVIDIEVIAAARDYSREAAIEYTIKIAGVGSLFISAAMIRGVWELLRSLGIQARRVPGWVWLVGIGAVCAALSSESVQSWLVDRVREWRPDARKAMVKLVEELTPLFEQHYESQRRANELRSVLVDGIDV